MQHKYVNIAVLSFLVLLAMLLFKVSAVHANTVPPSGSSRNTFLTFYRQCARVDDEKVVDEVLDLFIALLGVVEQKTAQGEPLPTIGWLSPSDASDLGWSYNSALGWQALQRCVGVKWFPETNVHEEDAPDAMRRLVDKGVSLIFATSAEFVGGVPQVALAHPEVSFLIPFPVEDFFTIPNIRAVNMNVWEASYLNGYIAEWMTPDHVSEIGQMGSVHFFTEYQNHNGFEFGRMDAARDMNREPRRMVYWWLNSYSDADKATFAAQDLVQNHDIQLVAQTVDRYESQRWLRDNGYNGMGATADMGQFLGSTVYASDFVRWDVPALYVFGLFMVNGDGKAWGAATPLVLPHSVWLGSLGYGTLSVDVPDEVRSRVDAIVDLMKTSPFASSFVFCGDRVALLLDDPADLDPVTKCLNATQMLTMNKLYPTIEDLGDFEIPLTEDTLGTGSMVAMIIIIVAGMLWVLFCLAMAIVKRNTATIRLQSDKLTWAVLVCSLVAQVGLLLAVFTPATWLCITAVVLYAGGVLFMLGVYATKTYGFYKLFTNRDVAHKVMLRSIIWPFVVVALLATTLIVLYAAVNNNGATTLTWLDSGELDQFHTRSVCDVDSVATIVLLSCMAGLCGLVSIVVAWICFRLGGKARIYSVYRSEARFGMLACGCTLFFLGIAVALVLTITDFDARLWVLVLCGFMINIGNVLIFYAPKMYTLVFDRNSPEAMDSMEYTKRAMTVSGSSSPRDTTTTRASVSPSSV
mmetsp:Transcript_25332/g.63532  ORF Transcript_25332/g.63532 Transcript_25332/m.63532 type:complete len:748 (+) Transcript_25332:33-2276(+)|eukprot:CAMPEP_0174234338 /NCGR_PEP_ID=MMETSP0417-20130205/4114_1 /TAXON_ID=242541 /ORGANISM="Mayorella sp, Strain BSH-02190019" /LENGTH=747 /DNA_ID=CAMNT_0015312683 /DNA_START=35 /DNA_END=2278 /DNA_ORIENTATION=+